MMSSSYVINPKRRNLIQCLRYLAQNFPTAVTLPRGRISDYPSHLRGRTAIIHSFPARLAGPLRRFTHAAAVRLLGPDICLYFHRLGLSSRTKNAARSPSVRLYTLASTPPAVCRPLSDVTLWNESMRSDWYWLPCMYIGVEDGSDMKSIRTE